MTDQISDQPGSNGEKAGDGAAPGAATPPDTAAATPLDTPTASGPAPEADAPRGDRFNPLTNESDMFKVLVGVVIFAAVVIALVLLGRAAF